jgi:hypothetical protein
VLATALRSCSWCWVRTAENTKSLPSLADLLFISSLVTSWMLRRSAARWRCRGLAGSRIHDLRHAATCLVLTRGLIGDSAGVDEACRNFDDERVLTPLSESADRAGLARLYTRAQSVGEL